jgi:hypothetical protein
MTEPHLYMCFLFLISSTTGWLVVRSTILMLKSLVLTDLFLICTHNSKAIIQTYL